METRTIYIIDASGYIHRAFHAIRGLRNSKGMATNALYGLSTMLKKFLREKKSEYCVAVFDASRISFRNEIFAQYKANRPPAPDDLRVQFPYARKIASALGFPVLEVEGYEADDVIATITKKALEKGFRVVIESSDKDLFQLVQEGVVVHDPMKDKVYDEQGVQEKLGVLPSQVRDYLAIVGDTSDNVPGVAGIGEKGAQELVSKFGSLEGIYANLDKVQGKKRESLENGKENAFLSRELVTLYPDVPLDVDIEELKLGEMKIDEIVPLFKELEFGSLLAEVGGATIEVSKEKALKVEWEEVREGEIGKVQELCEKAKECGIYFTLKGRDPVNPECLSLCIATDEGKAFVFKDRLVEQGVKQVIASDDVMKKAFVTQFKELYELGQSLGVPLQLPRMELLLAAYVLHPERESPTLPKLVLEHMKESLSGQTRDEIATLACATIRIGKELEEELKKEGLYDFVRDVEIPLSRVLAEMERTGVLIDVPTLNVLSREMEKEIAQVETMIIERAGAGYFNPNSPKQLADVLFGKMGLKPIKKTRKTKARPSTESEVLEQLILEYHNDEKVCELLNLILRYRTVTKLKGTYVDTLPKLIHKETGRVHTCFNQTVTATGRLSSSDPNLQNIPIRAVEGKRIRSAFVSPEGHVLVGADYSQIELRVLAHMSGDEQLIETFQKGIDIHRRTAAKIYGCQEDEVDDEMRRRAKTVNFGILYGMSAHGLAMELKISREEAQRFIESYFRVYPGVERYRNEVLKKAREQGFVMTLSGRKRRIEGLSDANKNVREGAERMATNTPIQGTAADIIKVAMVRLWDRLKAQGLSAKMILQVHDELVLEAKEEEKEKVCEVVKDVMENAWKLKVPLEVEVGTGTRWSETK